MKCNKRLVFGILGCFGGLFIHLVIGSLYQWGIVNLYITSFYKTSDPSVSLENNAIAFPVMMLCIGLTMRIGLYITEIGVHPLIVMSSVVLLQAGFVFISSFLQNMGSFIAIYGVLFGLASGFNFMIPVVQCNEYFPGKKMYVNGVVLTGTGLGSLVFGLFSYNYLNPNKLPPKSGYYLGTPQLQTIAKKVPEWLRWLSLLYLICGIIGILLISNVCIENRRKKNEQQQKQKQKQQQKQKQKQKQKKVPQIVGNTKDKLQIEDSLKQTKQNNLSMTKVNSNELLVDKKLQKTEIKIINQPFSINQSYIGIECDIDSKQKNSNTVVSNTPSSIKQSFCSKIWWLCVSITFLGTCGLFLLNGNYKTYVKNEISNDEMLTIIGVMNAVGNGFSRQFICYSRFFWNLLFNQTGYKFVMVLNNALQISIFIALRFTVVSIGGYLFCIFVAGCCMGGYLVMTPTVLQSIFGQSIGSNLYGFFWEIFGLANLIQYVFVSTVSPKITFNGIIYICLGMTVLSLLLIIIGNFHAPWNNPQQQLGYFNTCNNKQKKIENNKNNKNNQQIHQ